MVGPGVLVVRDEGGSLFKGELLIEDIIADRVKTEQGLLNGFIADMWFEQDMAYLDFVTFLVDKLNDMIAKL